jgi:hypothetical protein
VALRNGWVDLILTRGNYRVMKLMKYKKKEEFL